MFFGNNLLILLLTMFSFTLKRNVVRSTIIIASMKFAHTYAYKPTFALCDADENAKSNNKMTIPFYEYENKFIDWDVLNKNPDDQPAIELRRIAKINEIKQAKKRKLFYIRVVALPIATFVVMPFALCLLV